MKYLLLIVVLFVAYSLWRNARLRDEREDRARRPPPPGTDPQEMVRCPVCGVHLPRSEAVTGARGILYCSNEHRLRAGG
ncbi:MAG TPA: PP0621 family protein [Ramlibacter sp.]|uniref:PP0621 family protein n=1 Tax=Ramlibacter sp. TaxID=1917967 RepID=UPI002D80E501|nr:PP0621 family protein [Ramlibacter sp.]HET8744445.1 PP0621 family protein [Ramlibacter sp.]